MTWQEGLPDAGAPVADSTQVVPSATETQLLNGAYGGDYTQTQVADTGTGQGGMTFNDAFPQNGLDQAMATLGTPADPAATGDSTAVVTGDPNAIVTGDQTTLPQGEQTITPGVTPEGTPITTAGDQTGGGNVAVIDQQGRPVLMDASGKVLAVGMLDQSTQMPVMVNEQGVVVGQIEVDQATGSATIIDQTGQRIPIQMAQAEPGGQTTTTDQTAPDQTGLPADQTALPTDQTGGKFATLDPNNAIILTDQTGRTLAVATTDQSGQAVMLDEAGTVVAKLGTDPATGQQAIIDATTGQVIPFVQPGQQPPGGTTVAANPDAAAMTQSGEVNLSDVEAFLGIDPNDASTMPADPTAQVVPGSQTGGQVIPNGSALDPNDTGTNPYLTPNDAVADGPGTVASMTPDGMYVEGQTVVPPSDVQPQYSSPTFGAVISPEEQAAGIMPGMPEEQAQNVLPQNTVVPDDQRIGG
jgi:hypothetical protein